MCLKEAASDYIGEENLEMTIAETQEFKVNETRHTVFIIRTLELSGTGQTIFIIRSLELSRAIMHTINRRWIYKLL